MMKEQIEQFPTQFEWNPELINGERFPASGPIILVGMGGSHLGARLLATDPTCPPITFHSDYGLPHLPEEWITSARYIASSYSGETEETNDAAKAILTKGYPLAVIASGGTLLAFAKENNLPYVELPKEAVEPRMTMGYAMLALTRLFADPTLEEDVRMAGRSLSLSDAQTSGEALAGAIGKKIPAFYASTRNLALAYHLKADMNETGKIPATYNLFPELCHNELSGFEQGAGSLLPVFLDDDADSEKVKERMNLMRALFEERGIATTAHVVNGHSPLHKSLQTVLIGSYAGMALAAQTGVEDAATPLIAEFKKRMRAL